MAESTTQDPKYIIIDGALANAATREFIPEDEPIFILRGKDAHIVPLLWKYAAMCFDAIHIGAIKKCIVEIQKWQQGNIEVVDEPDTDGADQWPDH